MRFFQVVLSGAALLSAALAVEFNSWPESVKAGETVTLTYSPKDAATTIILRKGPSGNLDTLQTLTTTSTGGSFEWAVPSNLANGDDYAFEIRQAGAEPNYSGQFSLTGGTAAVSSGYSTASSASKTAASSAHSSAASTISTVVTTATSASASASGSIVPSSGGNSTISTGTPTASKSEATSSSTGSATGSVPPVENSGAASSLGVNAAALFGAIGAFAYFA